MSGVSGVQVDRVTWKLESVLFPTPSAPPVSIGTDKRRKQGTGETGDWARAMAAAKTALEAA